MSANTFDLIPDNFISYDDDFMVKQEKLSDPDLTMPSNFSLTFDSAPFYPSFVSPSLRSMLETAELTIKEPLVVPDSINVKRSKPFKIIRQSTKKEDHEDSIEVKIEPEKKVISNTRREFRREVAKKKTQRKMEAKNYPFTPNLSLSPDELGNLNLDDKTRKKMVQMIRNRMSAQNSRDRRRNYVQSLEHSKDILYQENLGLSVEKSRLLQEMERLKESNALLVQERKELLKKKGESRQSGETNTEQLNIEKYLSKLGILKGGAQKGMGVAFSLGLLLSVVMMMRINEQQNMLKLVFEGEEQVKVGMKSQESLLLEIEEKYMMPLRKCSQSTTVSSHGSPLIFAKTMVDTPNEIDMSRTMACYNDGTDDGWGSLDHGISPQNLEDFSNVHRIHIEPELHNKNFDIGGNDLLMNMQGALNHLKSMRSHDNQTGALLDLNFFN